MYCPKLTEANLFVSIRKQAEVLDGKLDISVGTFNARNICIINNLVNHRVTKNKKC